MAAPEPSHMTNRGSALDLIGRFVLQGTRSAPWTTYLFTLFAVGCAIAMRYGAAMLSPRALLFASFYPAILASTLFGGVGPGLFASALSLLSAWVLFISPGDPFVLPSRDQAVNLAFFAAMAGLSVFICASYRRLVEQLQKEDIKRSLLASELQHRNRNALMVTKAIVSQSLRDDRGKADDINQRLAAVYKSSELIVSADELSVGVESIVGSALSAYGAGRYSARAKASSWRPIKRGRWRSSCTSWRPTRPSTGRCHSSDGNVDVSWQADRRQAPDRLAGARRADRAPAAAARLRQRLPREDGGRARRHDHGRFAPTGLISRIAFPRAATV